MIMHYFESMEDWSPNTFPCRIFSIARRSTPSANGKEGSKARGSIMLGEIRDKPEFCLPDP